MLENGSSDEMHGRSVYGGEWKDDKPRSDNSLRNLLKSVAM
jgi:hypothetical protein